MALMVVGTVCFVTIPGPMLRVFSQDIRVIEIGRVGFHFVGMSFLPLVTSLTFPAVGSSLKSSLLTVIRTEVLFVPLGYLFSRFGLNWFWLTFPVTELVTTAVGLASSAAASSKRSTEPQAPPDTPPTGRFLDRRNPP